MIYYHGFEESGSPCQHTNRSMSARWAIEVDRSFFRRRRISTTNILRFAVFMLVMSEMLAGFTGFMHAIGARDSPAHLESKCDSYHVKEPFDHAKYYSA